MKIEVKTGDDGGAEVTLTEVYSGVGIRTDAGLFGIAQRDGGIEVMLNGKMVWARGAGAAEELPNTLPPPSVSQVERAPLTQAETERIATAARKIKAKVGPMLVGEPNVAAALALISMAAHHVLHDGGTEGDLLNFCRAAWKKSIESHRKDCGSRH